MAHRSDDAQRWALALVDKILARSERESDCLPGQFLHHLKNARRVLVHHQKNGSGRRSRKARSMHQRDDE